MSNPWAQLVELEPEDVESLFEKVFTEYGQAFKPLNVKGESGEIEVELKDGRKVKVKI